MNTTASNILLFFVTASFATIRLQAQDSVQRRIIFIGDAGKIDAQQKAVIAHASDNVLTGRTIVMYLGDNVYPRGFGGVGTRLKHTGQEILKSQFVPMRNKGAAVYFIPGNHDWDKMGKAGLRKIKSQWQYLEHQADPLLKMVPPNGCPDPVEIPVSDSVVMIAFDSEWWLFKHKKTGLKTECACTTSKDVTETLDTLFSKNRSKTIFLATHHPFQSYGHHGGFFSLKDHLFPLTSLNRFLFIPLPIAGSLYPLFRSLFRNREDLRHPLYRNMITQVDSVFRQTISLIHVAGHEHGLQFIRSGQTQIVSGAGAKNAFVKKGKHSLFSSRAGGYVTADVLADHKIRVTWYVAEKKDIRAAFVYLHNWQL